MKKDAQSRSASRLRESHLTQQSRITQTPFNQFIYINSQTVHKENATIFHSPYKNGKKNPNYANPTFMSSELFYPRTYVEDADESVKPRKAIVNPSPNTQKRREMQGNNGYESRSLIKSRSEIGLMRSQKELSVSASRKDIRQNYKYQKKNDNKVQSRGEKENQEKPFLKDSVVRLIQTTETLQRQIDRLKRNIVENNDKNNDRNSESRSLSRTRNKQEYQRKKNERTNERPVYFQNKQYTDDQIRHQTKQMLLKYLRESLIEKRTNKDQQKKQKNEDKKLMDQQYQRFKKNLLSTKKIQRERAKLLNEVLKNQIHK